ncbi:hypothetical protein IP84_16080 [beta proteobacterium AAP99]|nr:hypothetical protein IP84_16080 [beta proteobacterium AAP99]
MQRSTRISLILAITAAAWGVQAQSNYGQPQSPPQAQADMPRSMPAKPAAKSGMPDGGEGVVQQVNREAGTVTFMGGRTMKVRDPMLLTDVKAGQRVEFRVQDLDSGPVIVALKVLG